MHRMCRLLNSLLVGAVGIGSTEPTCNNDITELLSRLGNPFPQCRELLSHLI